MPETCENSSSDGDPPDSSGDPPPNSTKLTEMPTTAKDCLKIIQEVAKNAARSGCKVILANGCPGSFGAGWKL